MRLFPSSTNRRAATAVEFAVVCPVVLVCLFSIFEFCRLIMIKQLTENAVREGARYAVARTDTFQTGVNAEIIRNTVRSYLLQASVNLRDVTIEVYKSNQAGEPLDLNNNIVSSPSLAATFDQTKFGDYICISLNGTFDPILPSFVSLASDLKVTGTSIMCSEGN